MKSIFVLTVLLASVVPVNAADDMASERFRGYYYGYIYGIGNTLCGLVLDKQIKAEDAQDLFSGTVDSLLKDPEAKLYISYVDKAYMDITEDVVCKEVYQ